MWALSRADLTPPRNCRMRGPCDAPQSPQWLGVGQRILGPSGPSDPEASLAGSQWGPGQVQEHGCLAP